MRAYLGIDGGGTRTRSLLISESGEILGRAVVGPSNVQQVNLKTLHATLQELLNRTFINCPNDLECVAACFGLAGAASADNTDALRDLLMTLTPVPTAVPILTSDAQIALVGALGNQPGLMLIAGTGSICLGRDAAGRTHRTGGWGPAYDDRGSGYWIGQQAMQATFQEFDGRRPCGPWQGAVLNALQCSSIEAVLCKIKAGAVSRCQIAALAPMVIQLAESGFDSAREIIERAIHELVQAVTVTHAKANLALAPLVLMGGLLEKSESFRAQFITALQAVAPTIQAQKCLMSPIVGAVIVACEQSNGCLPRELEKSLASVLED